MPDRLREEISPEERKYTYSRNEHGVIVRNEDGVQIPEHDPENVVTKLYKAWLARGNKPPPGDGPRPNAAWTPPDNRPRLPEDTSFVPEVPKARDKLS
jgi:hypothetical protein